MAARFFAPCAPPVTGWIRKATRSESTLSPANETCVSPSGPPPALGSPVCTRPVIVVPSSGLSVDKTTAIATLVQVFGEEEAFKVLKGMHKNITNYARQGVGPIKATARGENLVAVAFIEVVAAQILVGCLPGDQIVTGDQ